MTGTVSLTSMVKRARRGARPVGIKEREQHIVVLAAWAVERAALDCDGAFAAETYKWMVDEWADRAVEFVSIPGVLAGQVALYDGQIVDAVIPDLRGMYSWETNTYIRAVRDARRKAQPNIADDRLDREINRFLGKIYFSIRNRGASPEERALNAAATNAFNFSEVITEAGADGMTLRDGMEIAVQPGASPGTTSSPEPEMIE
jgi:PatG C-terminal